MPGRQAAVQVRRGTVAHMDQLEEPTPRPDAAGPADLPAVSLHPHLADDDMVHMTAGHLRDVADTLDTLQHLTNVLYRPLATIEGPPDGTFTITIKLTNDGRPADAEHAQAIIDAVDGHEMQDTLRRWADLLGDTTLEQVLADLDDARTTLAIHSGRRTITAADHDAIARALVALDDDGR